jgi:hypothetical protein
MEPERERFSSPDRGLTSRFHSVNKQYVVRVKN